MTTRCTCRSSVILALSLFTFSWSGGVAYAQEKPPADDSWPRRVLITNDNGIDDPKIHALARAMSEVAEVYVAAPAQDESGTGSSMSMFRTGSVDVTPVQLEGAAGAWAVDGYPADCVIWAMAGPLSESPPDLILSGVNGGANIGFEWFGSGTVGAARTGAFGGVPALAISGLDDTDAVAMRRTMEWVVALAQSSVVASLPDGMYLTVSLPPTQEIKGVRVARRDRGLPILKFQPSGEEDGGESTWSIVGMQPSAPEPDGDVQAFLEGWIVVIPMRVHETDLSAVERLAAPDAGIPAWPDD